MTRAATYIATAIATLVACLTLAASAAPAHADQAPATRAASNGAATTDAQAKTKTLIFGEGDDVEGGVVGPDGENLQARDQIVYSSLIRVRVDFVAEIFKSAENL